LKFSSGIIWTAAVIVAVVLLAHMLPVEYLGRWSNEETNDVAHVLGFATLAFLAAQYLIAPLEDRIASPLLRYITIGAALVGLGITAEAAQILTSRNENFSDVLRDLAGISAGLSAHWGLASRVGHAWAMFVAAFVLLCIGLFQPVMELAAIRHAHRNFPVLATFESTFDIRAAQAAAVDVEIVAAPSNWGETGHVALLTPNSRRNYHGLAFTNMPRDWHAYSRLVFRASAAAPTVLTVRVNDMEYTGGYADRFNRDIEIDEQPRTIEIPLTEVEAGPRDRQLNLNDVERVAFYVDSAIDAFMLDDVRLE
jgi:hypothetical protein